MIRVENLTKTFDRLKAVDNLSLEVRAGELFAFLGPNGAGKTTTIKILTGLLRPTSGRTFIGNYDIQTQHVEAKQLIGYIPDHPYLYEKLSGRDFFQFIGDLYRIDRRRQAEKMEEFFTLFSLTDAADDLIENYSHGMRQKLVFSVALMHDPKALIIDEPMVGLDPKSSRVVKRLLKDRSRQGCAIFLSTHTLAMAEELADRIGIIH
ncbi:MAG: ABC transporter ATP-binding protein, partial [Candidatus Sumerlaeota bacterium]|nr:ABC transporter ATP-binding protein [Candidatus Sumerlaeota bacterium]